MNPLMYKKLERTFKGCLLAIINIVCIQNNYIITGRIFGVLAFFYILSALATRKE